MSVLPLKALRLSIRTKIILGFGGSLLLSLLLAMVCYGSIDHLTRTAGGLSETWRILESSASVSRHLTEMENEFQLSLSSGNSVRLARYDRARQAVVQNFALLESQKGAFTASQVQRLRALTPLIAQELAEHALENPPAFSPPREPLPKSTEELQVRIQSLLSDFQEDERRVLRQQTHSISGIARAATLVIASGFLLSLISLIWAGVFILRDIAVRRTAEQALEQEHRLLRSLIDAIPNVVFVKDLLGRYVISNKAHETYLDLADGSEIEGKTSAAFFAPEIAQQYREDDEKVMHSAEPLLNRLEPAIDMDGNFSWRSTSKIPLLGLDGKVTGLVCVSTDVTERQKADEKLRVYATQLQNSNEQLQEFASVASHDLQEPLRKVMAFGDRLKAKCADALTEQGREYLERMQDAARRMQTLIRDLLTLSRVTSQGEAFLPVDLAKIVREVLSDLEIRIEQTGARVEVGFLPTIEADPAQMRQLFQNLLGNALKFQRPGEAPEVIVSSRILKIRESTLPGTLPGDEVCQIVVQDNGIGFDAQFADRIFSIFQRLHSRGEYEGTGIGLSVCRKITDRHGGNIVAKSSDGEGATFIVTLPLTGHMRDTV